jgi:general secretion pathway protein G
VLKHIKSTEAWEEKSLGAKGFTLIELLVVIVILGILAAVVVFAVGGITDKGQSSACKTDARTLRTAAEAYTAQEGTGTARAADNGSFLKSAKFLSDTSENYTVAIAADGTVTVSPVAGKKCA